MANLANNPAGELGPSAVEWLTRDKTFIAGTLSRTTDIVSASAQGSWITDVEGKQWLDLTSGIGVTNTGHCHPHVVEAIQKQAAELLHTSITTHHRRNIELCERLSKHASFISDPQMFLCNTGAEAVDGAIKFARKISGRPAIVSFHRAFHGRTIGGTSLTTARSKYRDGYEPLLPSTYTAPYAYPLRMGGEAGASKEALGALDQLFALSIPPHQVAGVIVEPILGEGGYVVPPIEWLEGLRERCTEFGIMLIFDEIQCGAGRTGKFFAAESLGVYPDTLLFAKGIASGMPLGGIISSKSNFDKWVAGSHGSTFGGNPVSCAAALATLDIMEQPGFLDSVRIRGAEVMRTLAQGATPSSGLQEVRGMGFMIGLEFASALDAERVASMALNRRMIVLRCGTDDNVIRLIPPLNISDEDLQLACEILLTAMQ